jgi:predicted acyl esterase
VVSQPGQPRGGKPWPSQVEGRHGCRLPQNVLIPFFDTYLKDRKPAEPTPQVLIYNPAENHWDKFSDWPGATEQHLTPLYLQAKSGLSFQAAPAGEDSYDSDPAKPVPFIEVPVRVQLMRAGPRGSFRISALSPPVRMSSPTRLPC